MARVHVAALQFSTSALFGIRCASSNFQPIQTRRTISDESKGECQNGKCENSKQKNAKEGVPSYCILVKNVPCDFLRAFLHYTLDEYDGTPKRPRLSVFCSDKQLYAMLVDDQNKKCLFYGSTLQKSIRQDPSCSTSEAAKRVGEELIKACNDLSIHEISSYDRNGFATGERIQAFEIAVSEYGFLSR